MIPILGEKKAQQQVAQFELPQDNVPESYILHAMVGSLDIYAEAMDVIGPVVQFAGAYVSAAGAAAASPCSYKKRSNLSCFYSPVVWHRCPPPDWWEKRNSHGEAY